MDNNIEKHYVHTNGVHLHVLQAGPIDGPLVILLHGFPEFAYAWRQQISYLASAGFRVWAPDQRGYNLSDKPKGIASYTLDKLAKDVIGLIDAAKRKETFLVGHDWGGSVAWYVAAKYPTRITKMIVLSMPHRNVMKEHLRFNPLQRRKSRYIFYFQIPWLPELRMKLQNFKNLKEVLKYSSRPGTFSNADLKTYYRAWSKPKAYHSMINWYRAAIQKAPKYEHNPKIIVPTLLIWGELDQFLGIEMAQSSIDLCENGRLFIIKEATHWIQHEEADQVNKLINTFFQDILTD
ncbi:alpha/beta fold hydrolase [Sulfurovum riftiae]|uniref:Alpha/beta hydrolase n=1 Tax=Sulfurovum riftiae TaxID=1630136 RepID=A0A151CHP8_9BACT|nr:alpha/beta hydrolase [Sulfurovum riftiae]KYJ87041.1 alpha/beta hydrolase [Sulfurovum riftiae]